MSPPATTKASPARHLRDASLAFALVIGALSVVPPLSTEARRYVVAESIQFALIALAVPVFLVLGAPLERWQAGRSLITRCRSTQRTRGPLGAIVVRLGAFFAATIAWRTPDAVDGLVRFPFLIVAEVATFLVIGVALWTELVVSPPLVPRLSASQRMVVAAVSMWMIWILAYFVGFSHTAWYPTIHHTRSALSLVADQELAAGVMWAAAAAAFVPVVFVNLIRFLHNDDGLDSELDELLKSSDRSTSTN